MRVLFFFRHGGYVRNFEPLLDELAERGHTVHALLGKSRMRWLEGRRPPIELIAERRSEITYGLSPDLRPALSRQTNALRGVLDWLRYLRPEYEHAPKLRARVEERVPAPLRRALLALGAATPAGNRAWRRVLNALERALPWSPAIDRVLAEHAPDVVCVTPLVDLGNSQPDVLRAARSAGIPAVACIASWDNLTNKGLIRGEPDLVTVWNEFQREEAVQLHRQRPERVVATGAQAYDHWFTWRPERSRADFMREVGLDADRPMILFLGSSPFIAPDEVPFVRRWVAALRAAGDELVREAGVLVRPHPQNGAQWRGVDLSTMPGVVVWPPGGADPIDAASRSAFHDSIHNCAAVVGINTSALIESAIVGRPVLTILGDDFAETQEGTLHFEHLRRAGGGVLREAASLDEHTAQLAQVLRGNDGFQERNRSFLGAFVRPQGLDRPSAPVLADALERVVAGPPGAPGREPLVQRLAGLALRPFARRADGRARARAKRSRIRVKRATPERSEATAEVIQ